MKLWAVVLIIGMTACSSGKQSPEVAPEPEIAPAPTAPLVQSEVPTPPSPEPTAAESIGVAQLADSVRDEEMLERLHEVSAAPTDSGLPESGLASMFDINVARYAEHDRVKFYLDFFQGPARERMTVWLGRMPLYAPMARAAFAARGLPLDLAYLALIESGYSNTAVSRSKAVGMWQFMRGTGKEYGLRIDQWIDERRDPIKATNAAARYLADLTSRFGGSHYLAAAAYNGGGGRVSRGLRKLGSGADEAYFEEEADDQELADDPTGDDRFFHLSDSRYLRKETKDYVPKLIAAAMIAKQPEKYGFPAIPAVEPYEVDSIPVTEPTSLEVVAKAGGLSPDAIVALNPHFVRQITPPGGLAWVRVPTGQAITITEALAAVPADERVTSFAHVVGRRESVRSIAKRYGLSAAELASFNVGIGASATLRAGTIVRVPGRARVRAIETEPAEPIRGRAGAVHRVRSGETLSSIARRYRVSVRQILAWNDIPAQGSLRVGQRLRVGPTASAAKTARAGKSTKAAGSKASAPTRATTHVVKRGETLTGLAKKYNTTIEALMQANGLRSSRGLTAGVRLTIPT